MLGRSKHLEKHAIERALIEGIGHDALQAWVCGVVEIESGHFIEANDRIRTLAFEKLQNSERELLCPAVAAATGKLYDIHFESRRDVSLPLLRKDHDFMTARMA
jgi:hypothetical protein